MKTNIEPPVMPAESNDSRTARDKAVVCKELLDENVQIKEIFDRMQETHDASWTELCILTTKEYVTVKSAEAVKEIKWCVEILKQHQAYWMMTKNLNVLPSDSQIRILVKALEKASASLQASNDGTHAPRI